jgi:hypothetical protein
MQTACELASSTPLSEEFSALCDPTKERIQERNDQVDLKLRKLKECP